MTTAVEERVLPGGLLRTCRPGDLGQVGALLAARGDPTAAEDQRPAVQDPYTWFEMTAVVVDGDRLLGPQGCTCCPVAAPTCTPRSTRR
jgi:hypothetical protein